MLTPPHAFAIVVVALFLKMFAIAVVQGRARIKNRTYERASDAKFAGKTAPDAILPIVDRGQRALRNDLENIPIFLFLAWTYITVGGWQMGVHIYFPIFVLARFAHTWAYLADKQPARTIAWSLGTLISFVLSGHILFSVASAYL